MFATELHQVGKKMLTIPRFISRMLPRQTPLNDAQEGIEARSNSSLNTSNLNIPNSTLAADSLHQNNTNRRMEPRCNERNVLGRAKSLYLPSRCKQRGAKIVCMDAQQGIVHMEMIEQELPSIASL